MAEVGVDLVVMQALLGHAQIDTTARYVQLAPTHVKAEFDAESAASVPAAEPTVPPASKLLATWRDGQVVTSRGNPASDWAARTFLDRWPIPQA